MTALLRETYSGEPPEENGVYVVEAGTWERPGTQALQPRRDPAAGGYDLEDEDDWPIGGLA
jgi:hypothetical protein